MTISDKAIEEVHDLNLDDKEYCGFADCRICKRRGVNLPEPYYDINQLYEHYYNAWEATQKRCGELERSLKSQRELHRLEVKEYQYEIDKLNAMLRLFESTQT